MPTKKSRGLRLWPIRGAIVAVALFSLGALSEAIEANVLPALFPSRMPDFFIMRSGVVIALGGESPYEPQKVQALVAQQFPADTMLIANSAFLRSPATIPLFAPLALLPYAVAKAIWALGLILSAIAVLLGLRAFGTPWPGTTSEQFLPLLLLLNYITLVVIELGQTSFLFVGCVLAGQWCFDRSGRFPVSSSRWRAFSAGVGALLWSIPFLKPNLAFPLLALAWYLGGWRRPAAILVVIATLNCVGCLMIGHSPLFLWDYVQYLGSAHLAIIYNRAELNPTITSWNRLLFTLGGPLVELTAATTLASYAVWFLLVIGRVALAGVRPSAAWAAAVTAIGGVLCAQVMIYDLLFLILVIPWIRILYARGYLNLAWLALGLIGLQLIPVGTMVAFGIVCHHALGVALLAALVLVGPIAEDSGHVASFALVPSP
jgi:hypothetical protein